MLLLISFLAHSIIRFLSKKIKNKEEAAGYAKKANCDDTEQEVFLFNESSFVNLFECSKFNSVASENNFTNLLSQSEKSFKFGTDEDFFTELTEENLKLLGMSSFELNTISDELLLDCSPASSPRFNSLFNSLTSMDLELNESKDTESICGLDADNFFEDEKLINESIIASCTFTDENNLNASSSNISESSLESLNKNSTPIQLNHKKKLVSLRNNLLINSYNSSPIKGKKFLPKCERNRIATKFYKRNRTSSKNTQLVKYNNSLLKKMSKNLRLASYKPSTKVERLLNDSRGMRKYLVDYEENAAMNYHQNNLNNLTYASLVNQTLDNTVVSINPSPDSTLLHSNSLRSVSRIRKQNRRCNSTSSSLSRTSLKSNFKTLLKNTSVSANRSHGIIYPNQFSSNRSSSGYLTDC